MRFLCIFIVLLAAPSVFAYSLTPMVAELSADGREASKTFTVQNPSDTAVPIEVSVFERSIDPQGVESRTKTNDIQFFPEQFVLKGKETRNLRLTYRGPKEVLTERSFRLVVEQLPVDLKKSPKKGNQVQLDFRLSFVASLYVLPKNPTGPKLRIESVKPLSKTAAELNLVNEGNVHVLLKDIEKISFPADAGKSSKDLRDADLKLLESEVTLAGSSRKVRLEWKEDFDWPAKPTAELTLRR